MSSTENPDTGDVVDPDAPDVTRDEITDTTHVDFVAPFTDATPITTEA